MSTTTSPITSYVFWWQPSGLLPGGTRIANTNTYNAIVVSDVGGGYGKTVVVRHPMEFNWDKTDWGDILTPFVQNIAAWFLSAKGVEPWGIYGPGCFNLNYTINMTAFDDHPLTGTASDDINVTVYLRDDDHDIRIPGGGIGGISAPATIDQNAYYSYTYSYGQRIVADKDYNLHSIYVDYSRSPYQVNTRKSFAETSGESWEANVKVSNQPWFTGTQYYPSIASDGNSTLHAVWRGYASGGSATSYRIRYACSKDGGATWVDHYNVTSTGSTSQYNPTIAVDKNDNVHIAWYGYYPSSPYRIQYRKRASDGTWGSIVQISENIYSQYPYIACDSIGNVHIVWRGYLSSSLSRYNIRHIMYYAKTNKWSSIWNVTYDTASSSYSHYYPKIAVDPNNNVHAVWYGRDAVQTSYYSIMYSKFDLSTKKWSAREYITTSSNRYQYHPSISVNGVGEVDVVWYGYQSTGSTPYAIHHAEKTSTGWNVNWDLIASRSYQQYYPRMLCALPNSRPAVGFAFVWFDNYRNLKYYTS
jgi:hypothetical protein